MQFPSNK